MKWSRSNLIVTSCKLKTKPKTTYRMIQRFDKA
jgi:hypothetical protein